IPTRTGVRDELLTLLSLAPVARETPGGHWAHAFLGRWHSDSPYLGKHNQGYYYVKHLNTTTEDRWASGVVNPVGYFFDSDHDWALAGISASSLNGPFLALYGFEPMQLAERISLLISGNEMPARLLRTQVHARGGRSLEFPGVKWEFLRE